MNEDEPTQEDRIECLQRVIEESPEKIEGEFRTSNTWIACVGTRVFVIETWLNLVANKQLLPEEVIFRAREKLEKLKLRIYEFRNIYDTKDKIVPDDIKQELLRSLRVLD